MAIARFLGKENERLPSVALLCAGLLSSGMVYELERVLRVCDGFFCSISATYDGEVLLLLHNRAQGKTKEFASFVNEAITIL